VAESLRIKFRRRLFESVCVMSLILCLATAGLWVRSYARLDWLIYGHLNVEWLFANMRGQLRAERLSYDAENPFVVVGWLHKTEEATTLERVPGSNVYIWSGGFGLVTGERWGTYHHALLVPHWFPALLFALAPA
jgi:hypothetical protein